MSTALRLAKAVEDARIWVPHDSNLVLHRPTGMWYVRARKKGKRPLFKTTGFDQKGKAKTKALSMIAEWMGKRKTESVTLGDTCDWVLENYTPKKRIGTQKKHAIYIRDIKNHMGHWDVNDITPASLGELITAVKDTRRYSKSGKLLPTRKTFFDYAIALNLVMRHAYNNRWSTHMVRFSNPDQTGKTGRLLTRGEVTDLWNVMSDETRDQFVLCFECFMRLREAIQAPWSEVDLKTGEWTLSPDRVKTGSKTGEGRSFIMSPNALERLRARRKKMGEKSLWIFPSPKNKLKPIWSNKKAWAKAKREACVKGRCRWHDLRHTSLTWALLGDPDATDRVNAKMIRNPIQVSVYAGVSMRTIQSVYLKKKASQTKSVSGAVKLY